MAILEYPFKCIIVIEYTITRGSPPGNSIRPVHVKHRLPVQTRILRPVERIGDMLGFELSRQDPFESCKLPSCCQPKLKDHRLRRVAGEPQQSFGGVDDADLRDRWDV